MERHEALRFISQRLDKIIPYLEKLKKAVEPEFWEKGFRTFDVGVDVRDTSVYNEIAFCVRVYTNKKRINISRINISDVLATVCKVKLDYDEEHQVLSSVQNIPKQYPTVSMLNLAFLIDWKKSLELAKA